MHGMTRRVTASRWDNGRVVDALPLRADEVGDATVKLATAEI